MTIQDLCFEYFKSVNPIAQKIGEDIERIVGSQEGQWKSLDVKEKDKLLDHSLIDEGLVKKYEAEIEQDSEEEYAELSTFSWFTRSQLNLFSLINVKRETKKTPLKKGDVLSPVGKTKGVSVGKTRRAVKEEKSCPRKPKTPPPPPPGKLVPPEQSRLLSPSQPHPDDIPKTGFDFLDNW